jgi:hypothetical protein
MAPSAVLWILDEKINGWLTNSTPLSHLLARQITKALLVAENRDTMATPSSIEPSPTEYRRFADECLRWADRVPRLDQKNTLIEIAKVWMHAALMIEDDQAHSGPPRCRLSTAGKQPERVVVHVLNTDQFSGPGHIICDRSLNLYD